MPGDIFNPVSLHYISVWDRKKNWLKERKVMKVGIRG